LVNYPMTIESTAIDRSAPRRAATAALIFTLLLLPVLGLIMFWAAGTTAGLATGAIAVIAMLLWQIQETLRRSLIAVLRVAACIPGDAISYLGQALGVYLLILTGHLSLSSALLVVAGTSAAAIGVQGIQIGLARLQLVHVTRFARQFWLLGRWNLLAAVTMFITSTSFPWVLRWGSGLDAVAVLMAISVPMKLTNPVMNSIGGLIIPAISRRMREQGARAAIAPALRYGALGFVLLSPCYALTILAPAFVLRLVFGSASPYVQAAGLLRIWSFYWVANYLSVVFASSLLGLHQSRLHFAGQLLHAFAVAAIALPAGYLFGVRGLITGAVVCSSIDLLIGAFLLRYAIRSIASSASQLPPFLSPPDLATLAAEQPLSRLQADAITSAA
jgi:O-antigen/teichoic acid export membrane protein